MSDIARVTLGGVADTVLGIVLMPNYDEPILPRPRQRFVRVPGRPGRREFDGDVGERIMRLRFTMVDGTTQATFAALLRDLAEILLDNDGVPSDTTIVFAKESDRTYTARYAGNIPVRRINGGIWGEFFLPMLCSDPFAYGTRDLDSYTITADPETDTINNAGDYTTPPVLTFNNLGGANVVGFTLVNRQEK